MINSGGGSQNSTKSQGGQDSMPDRGMGERPELPNQYMNGGTGERPHPNQSTSTTEETISIKAIKATSNIIIDGGTIEIDSCDASIHSNNSITINGGTINITKSYEGLESEVININGGYVYVDANGDGIDSNGNITMKDGTLIVNGPTSGGDGSLDYDGTFDISGGTLISSGSSGMLQTPISSSSQNVLNISLTSQEANTIVNIQSEDGKEILTFAPSKNYQSVVVSTPNIKSNEKYTVSVGGSSAGKSTDGLYSDGKYSGGESVGSETAKDAITNITQEGASAGGTMGGSRGKGQPGGQGERKEMMNSSGLKTTQQ